MSSLEVITSKLEKNPQCFHGPSLLFVNGDEKFYSCSACRDRKDCSFYFRLDDIEKYEKHKDNYFKNYRKQRLLKKSHYSLFVQLNKVKAANADLRRYCFDCNTLYTNVENLAKDHEKHNVKCCISDQEMNNPSTFLKPLDNPKKEAQFLFSSNSVTMIVDILEQLKLRTVLCIGTPRLHEYIQENGQDRNFESLLLDIDQRYQSFFGPMQFCWFNLFNNFFFDGSEAEAVFDDFLQSNKNELVIVMDPPFGGRLEPIAYVLDKINEKFKKFTNESKTIPIMLIFPYFMESHINNQMDYLKMLDYMVDYDNHKLFSDQPKSRKNGSPVRIFTNIPLSLIDLSKINGYKYCKKCNKYVYEANNHCKKCKACTSKDGSTYKHCDNCQRCVKPSWTHCDKCNRCDAANMHKCDVEIGFNKTCFHCKQTGHKKRECPNLEKLESEPGGNKKTKKRKNKEVTKDDLELNKSKKMKKPKKETKKLKIKKVK